jgi:hypothetical protein
MADKHEVNLLNLSPDKETKKLANYNAIKENLLMILYSNTKVEDYAWFSDLYVGKRDTDIAVSSQFTRLTSTI